jgi:hypothetical protein
MREGAGGGNQNSRLHKKFWGAIVKNMVGIPHKKLPLVVLTACLAFAALFAESFVLANIDHAHTGEHCSLCLHIRTAQNLLEGLGRAALFALAACLAPQLSTAKKCFCFSADPQTLVELKIKNNS